MTSIGSKKLIYRSGFFLVVFFKDLFEITFRVDPYFRRIDESKSNKMQFPE